MTHWALFLVAETPMTDRPMPQETVATRAAFRASVKGTRYTENPDPDFDLPVATDNTPGPEREALRDRRATAGTLRSRGRLRGRAGAAHGGRTTLSSATHASGQSSTYCLVPFRIDWPNPSACATDTV